MEKPFQRYDIRPFWHILAPEEPLPADGVSIRVRAGAGFGTGSHETTQLCLQALALFAPRDRTPGSWRLLDFGSGSAILSIAAARLGADCDAVEIDEQAIQNGEDNARLNGVADRIRTERSLNDLQGSFSLVIANILRPILLEFADPLVRRLAPGGTLILSGLLSAEVPELAVRYGALLGGREPEVYRRGDWCALVWRVLTQA